MLILPRFFQYCHSEEAKLGAGRMFSSEGEPLTTCSAGGGAEEGPGQVDGEKGFFPRGGLTALIYCLSVLLSSRSRRKALVHAAVFPTVWGRVGVIPACHIPISPHFLQAGVRQRLGRPLRACMHADTWRATEPITCMFTK